MAAGVNRGVFVRRLERALLDGEIDLAVHSLKDMPTEQPEGLKIAAVLERHDPRDAILSTAGWGLAELPAGCVVGTGSPRRSCQLLHARPDLQIRPICGNVDTRVLKLQNGEYDALVLALAGIERLGIDSVPAHPLEIGECVPAVGQGALAIETREADSATNDLVATLNHERSAARVRAERAFLRRLGGGCLAPATAYAHIEEDRLHIEALVGSLDGRTLLIGRESGTLDGAETFSSRLAERLVVEGAESLLDGRGPC